MAHELGSHRWSSQARWPTRYSVSVSKRTPATCKAAQTVACDHSGHDACPAWPEGREGNLQRDGGELDLRGVLGGHADGVSGDDVQKERELVGSANCRTLVGHLAENGARALQLTAYAHAVGALADEDDDNARGVLISWSSWWRAGSRLELGNGLLYRQSREREPNGVMYFSARLRVGYVLIGRWG